jgi:putative polyketide hydroxylase
MLYTPGVSSTLTQETSLSGKSVFKIPVLIVGAGPTGLCTCLLLSRYGIPSLLIERHASTSIHPRATGVSTRSMELLRQWGLDQRVRAAGLNVTDYYAPVKLTLAQPEVARRPIGFPPSEEAIAVSPIPPCACPQDALEPLLLEAIQSYDKAQVVFGAELATLEQDGEGVSATVIDRATGETTLVQAQYVVATDGAHSQIRKRLGIAMEGPDQLANYLSILFRADLKRFTGDRIHGLYFIQHPEATGVFVPTSKDGRWILGKEWHPEHGERFEDYDRKRCITLVRTAVGEPDLDVELLGVQSFAFAAQIAQRYQQGNIFLVGDAAHRMTPSGGMGMNTGIHDAHNLAWKLAAVLEGWADPMLLQTYESERRPVGLRNVKRSMGQLEGDEASWSSLEVDMGYCYESRAIMAEPRATDCTPATQSRLSCRSGRRAPHVWLTRDGNRLSTLDLYDQALTLVAGSAGTAWCEAAHQITQTYGVPLMAYLIGPEGELQDVDHHWSDAHGINAEGALLVRPDGFVAWRQPRAVSDHQTVLRDVIEQIIGHSLSHPQVDTGLYLEV